MQNKKLIFGAVVLALALLTIFSTSSTLGASSANTTNTRDEFTPPFAAPENPGKTDVAIQGTMWQPQTRKGFSLWQPLGWGTATRRKANKPADQWVHIGVPLITFLNGTALKVQYVEFCATSTNGAVAKPTRMDVWDNTAGIGSSNITWPADNAYHCAGRYFTPAAWRSTLGISVLLHFDNTTDTITLHKAWVHSID
jgi:hypothetical protein